MPAVRSSAMRKIVLGMSVSLDGFIEGPNREIDWHLVDAELRPALPLQRPDSGLSLAGSRVIS